MRERMNESMNKTVDATPHVLKIHKARRNRRITHLSKSIAIIEIDVLLVV